jgi:hypothetical protein
MNTQNTYHLRKILLPGLLAFSWGITLFSVNFPYDHVLPYSPILMYVIYSLLVALSFLSLFLVFRKPILADIINMVIISGYFILFTILFIKRLLLGYVMFFPLMCISLLVMAVFTIITIITLLFTKGRSGYILSIIVYSLFLLCVILESYPVVYYLTSQMYANIKLVYFVTVITASILGIIHSAKMIK